MTTRKQVIRSDALPRAIGPYSAAVRAGDFVFVSGQAGIDPATGKAAPDFETQARQALRNVDAALRAAGSSLERVVKTTVFLRDPRYFAEMNRIYATAFPNDPPARSTPIAPPPREDLLIAIDAIAVVGEEAT